MTEPPKKPRASYLFFQCIMRSYYNKRNPDASVSELMALLGDKWKSLSEPEQAPFIQLAREEAELYEKERALLEKAQKPNEMWQPLRRCLMVLDRLEKDSFAEIFLEPVDLDEFPDYEELIDSPMDLGTIRQKLADRKYQAPENFARDVRKVSLFADVFPSLVLFIISDAPTPFSITRCGTTVRSTTSTALLSGMWLITCRSSSSDCTTPGFWSSENATFDGSTQRQGRGNTLVAIAMESVVPLMTRWCFVIIAMPCTEWRA